MREGVGSSDPRDANVARRWGNAHGCGDLSMQIIGRGRLADRSDLAVFSPEGRGGAAEIGEDIAEGGPAVMPPASVICVRRT